jgi:hypothetical protein
MSDEKTYEVGGVTYHFPAEYEESQIKDILTKKGAFKQPTPLFTPPSSYTQGQSPTLSSDEAMGAAKQAAPFLGRAAGNQIPFLGSFAGPLGTIAGSALKQGLQTISPKYFGQGPEDLTDFALGVGGDLIKNNLLPSIVSRAAAAANYGGLAGVAASAPFRWTPSVREAAAKEMTSQIMSRYAAKPESEILGQAANQAQGTLKNLAQDLAIKRETFPSFLNGRPVPHETPGATVHPEIQSALDELNSTFKNNSVGKSLVRLSREIQAGKDVAGSQTFKSISNEALSDIRNVRNILLVAHPSVVENLALNKLLTNGFKESTGKLSADGILNELGGAKKEIYGEAIRPETMDSLKGFLGELKKQEVGNAIDKVVNWSNGHLMWAPLAASYAPATTGAAVGTVITNKGLAKMLNNPDTAKLLVQAMRTPKGTPQGDFIEKALMNALRSTTALATTPDQ